METPVAVALIALLGTVATVLVSGLTAWLTSRYLSRNQRLDLTKTRRDKLFERRLQAADALSPHFAELLYLASGLVHLNPREAQQNATIIENEILRLNSEMMDLAGAHMHVLPRRTHDKLIQSWTLIWKTIEDSTQRAIIKPRTEIERTEVSEQLWKLRSELLVESWLILGVLEDEEVRSSHALVKSVDVEEMAKLPNPYLRSEDAPMILSHRIGYRR